MNIAFRVDASTEMGTGHLMRCLALADTCKRRAVRTRFVCRHIFDDQVQLVLYKGHQLTRLPEHGDVDGVCDLAHSRWLRTSQELDASDTARGLAATFWDWLVVDHYALDARWESTLRSSVLRILAIDDIADRRHDCDMLLDQNYHADMEGRYVGRIPERCRSLLGPRYALLREEFRERHAVIRPREGPVSKVLVFFGGVDADNCTERAVNAVASLPYGPLQVDVVIGAQHPARERIESACQRRHYKCHVQTQHMAELMAEADLAIGAGGSSSWERCCLGLPAVCVSLADNQVGIAQALHERGAVMYLGSGISVSHERLRAALASIIEKPDLLVSMSIESLRLVDGGGAARVCDQLLSGV